MRIIVVVLLMVSAPAWAQKPKIQAAKEQFNKGETEYRLSRFQQALDHYLRATELFREAGIALPNLSFNIGQCYRQLRYARKSVFYYELYLSDYKRKNPDKPVPYSAEVKEHINRLSRDLLRAADLTRAAEDLQLKGDHKQALGRFLKIWESVREPRTPYQIARCQLKLQRKADARRYLTTYLAEWAKHYPGQPVPYGDQARRTLAELDRPAASSAPAADPPAEDVKQPAAVTKDPDGTTANDTPPVAKDPDGTTVTDALVVKPSRWRRPWAWVFAGVGLAGLVAGSALLATRRVDELVQTEVNGPFQRVTDDAVAGSVLVGVGGAAAVVSVILFARPEREAAPMVALGPRGFVAGYAGRF